MNTPKETIKVHIKGKDVAALLVSCLLAGFLLKIPTFFNVGMDDDLFYRKFVGWIVFFSLSLYAILRGDITQKSNVIVAFFAFLIPGFYMLLLTPINESHSINLAYIHIPLLMWGFYGMIRMDFDFNNYAKRIDYLRYIGDVLVFTALILAAGIALSLLSFGLFGAIGISIQDFYLQYIAILGLASAPIVSTFIVNNFPQVKNKLAPIIAYIFSPLALITLLVFLVSIPFSGKDLFNDRPFLLVFNLMLLGVMALIVYAASGLTPGQKNVFMKTVLLLLVIVAILIDLYALTAISYRILSFGVSPNKVAVLISNLLIFMNLLVILIDLVRILRKKATIDKVLNTVACYLPVYLIWTLVVAFSFPLIFGMK